MAYILKTRSTHAERLERWCGRAHLEKISEGMRTWYGPDIAMAGVPGLVYARRGGDFVGPVSAGRFSNYTDHVRARLKLAMRGQSLQFNSGFASLAVLQQALRNGYRQELAWLANTTSGSAGQSMDTWNGALPTAFTPANAPGGTAVDVNSAGRGLPIRNAQSGRTLHFVQCEMANANNANGHLLIDRLFAVRKASSSVVAEAVTGVPTRYQSTTPADPDYAGGNFVYPLVQATLGATAHNWTVCQYTDQDGNAGASFPSQAGVASAANGRIDIPPGQWFLNLGANDIGVKALTQLQCDASVTGTVDFHMAHPIAFLCAPSAAVSTNPLQSSLIDGITSAFQMTRVFDSACLSVILPTANGSESANPGAHFVFCEG